MAWGIFKTFGNFILTIKNAKIALFVFFLGVKLAEFYQIIAEFAKI